MKKGILSITLALMMCFAAVGLVGCNFEREGHELVEITVTDSDGVSVTAYENPTKVAIYDYAILDILDNVGFENTGIEKLIVPAKANLPDDLSFYKNKPDSEVVSGGSLFYVDWDVLDIVEPQLVILGARSFGMNANGDRLSSEENAEFKNSTLARYPNTRFVKLSVNTSNAQLAADMQRNTESLKAIFTNVAEELDNKLNEMLDEMDEINQAVSELELTAMFCMMVDQSSLSVYNPNSRFDMLYEEFGFIAADPNATAWDSSHGFSVRAEYVLAKDPDVIFLLDRSATVGTGAGFDNFMADESIRQTTAYQNDDIYLLSGNAWYTMTGGFTAMTRMIADINQMFE